MANRKERRGMMKQQGLNQMPRVRTYNISEDQVRSITQNEMKDQLMKVKSEAITWTSNCLFAAFVIAMNATYGFGATRMSRILEEVDRQFQEINSGILDEDDLLQCAESLGIKITKGGTKYETNK